MNKISGIYCITNIINNKCYIGSTVNIQKRWERHKRELKQNIHHSIVLQRAYNKYGVDAFKYEVLVECSKNDLIKVEQEYLNEILPVYNICPNAGSQLGRIRSEESKEKNRIASKKLGLKPPKSTWEKRQKQVIMMNDSKEELKEFDSISEACRYVGKDATFASCITRAIKLESKSYDYYWKFKEENIWV